MSATRVRECDVVGRYTIRRQTPVRVVASLVSARASARRQQWIVWNAKKVVKRIAGRPYLYVRSLLLGQ